MIVTDTDKLLTKNERCVLEYSLFNATVTPLKETGLKGDKQIELYTDRATHVGQIAKYSNGDVALHNYIIDRTGIYDSLEKPLAVVEKFYKEAKRLGRDI